MNKKVLLLITLLIMFTSCYKQNKTIYNFDFYVNNYKIDSWVNLMPGINMQPAIYLVGELSLKSIDEKSNVKLSKIEIYQNEKLILSQQPISENMNNQTSLIKFKIPEIKNFSSLGLKMDDSISLKLWFELDENFFYYNISNIFIQKVY